MFPKIALHIRAHWEPYIVEKQAYFFAWDLDVCIQPSGQINDSRLYAPGHRHFRTEPFICPCMQINTWMCSYQYIVTACHWFVQTAVCRPWLPVQKYSCFSWCMALCTHVVETLMQAKFNAWYECWTYGIAGDFMYSICFTV